MAVDNALSESFPRWAILATLVSLDSGISDLLTAELSRESFELVECGQIEAIAKEIELSKLLRPQRLSND